jgi:two-component system, LytTR family, sensor kinase
MNSHSRRQLYIRWTLASAAWWTVSGLITAAQHRRLSSAASDYQAAAYLGVLDAIVWVPIALVALRVAEQWPIDRAPRAGAMVAHVLAAVGALLVRGLAEWQLLPAAGLAGPGSYSAALGRALPTDVFLFVMTSTGAHYVLRRARERARSAHSSNAQLMALRTQLQPDFLFNTLNTINTLIYEAPERAERVLSNLSGFLRRTLAEGRAIEVPLDDELRVVGAYLEIEAARFEDRLRVVWEVEPAARGAMVPQFLLQPLVESALRHGVVHRRGLGLLTIRAEETSGMLRMLVSNSGRASASGSQRARLETTRARLAELYPGRHGLEVKQGPGEETHVEILLPWIPYHPSTSSAEMETR